jgi:hypothetical protein
MVQNSADDFVARFQMIDREDEPISTSRSPTGAKTKVIL